MNLSDEATALEHQTNVWLKPLLARSPLPHDWFAFLVYNRIAQYFGNSRQGDVGPSPCWYISLGELGDINAPDFKGIFLTQKGSLGLLSHGHVARFYNGIAFIGKQHAALEGIGITLVAVGLDKENNVVFVLTDGYQRKFGVPDFDLANAIGLLRKSGALILGVGELLASNYVVEVMWTAPSGQANPTEPQAVESVKSVAPGLLACHAA